MIPGLLSPRAEKAIALLVLTLPLGTVGEAIVKTREGALGTS